jgi:AcrR family transcriptional regulator
MVAHVKSTPLDRSRWARAALDVLERGGLAAVAVEPLARELGVTKGSFYWHFANRQELIEAALEHWREAHVDGPLEAVATIADPRERLLALSGRARAKPPSILIRLMDASDVPAVRAALAYAAQARVEFMTQAFRELGQSPAKARRNALLIYTSYVGRAHLERDAPDVLGDPDKLSRHLAEQLISP